MVYNNKSLYLPDTFSSESVRLAEYPCHSVILASRSQLLRNLINRRMAESHPDSTEIVLDDAVVGYKYAPLILKLIYQVIFVEIFLAVYF